MANCLIDILTTGSTHYPPPTAPVRLAAVLAVKISPIYKNPKSRTDIANVFVYDDANLLQPAKDLQIAGARWAARSIWRRLAFYDALDMIAVPASTARSFVNFVSMMSQLTGWLKIGSPGGICRPVSRMNGGRVASSANMFQSLKSSR